MSETYKYSLEIILDHILVCEKRFEEIQQPNDFIATEQGNILLDAIVTRLQAIGENVKRITKGKTDLVIKYPEVEWSKIIKFRDFISHHYEMLDYEVIFDICKIDLHILKVALQIEIRS